MSLMEIFEITLFKLCRQNYALADFVWKSFIHRQHFIFAVWSHK